MTTEPKPEAPVQAFDTTIRKTVASYSYQRSVYDVHQEFDQLDPQAIGDACQAWKRAADELLALADGLKAQAAAPLSQAWTSPASPAAQQQLRQAEATARALASDCLQMAHATDYAAQYAQWYKDNLPSYTDALASGAKGVVTGQGLTGGADAATQHLVNLLSRYNEVITTLPSSVQAKLVNSGSVEDFKPITGGGGAAGGTQAPSLGNNPGGITGSVPSSVPGSGSGHSPSLPGGGIGTGGSDTGGSGLGPGSSGPGGGIGTGTSGIGSGDPYAAGTSLAGTGLGGGVSGFDPGALGSGASGAGGAGGLGGGLGSGLGAGALGATGLGAGGLAGGLGAGRSGASLGGAGAAGSFGGGPGLGGTGGAGLAAEEAAAAGAGRGVGMMPMHGAGGSGEGEEERQRSTWLTEDDDVWGTGGDVPPPVISN